MNNRKAIHGRMRIFSDAVSPKIKTKVRRTFFNKDGRRKIQPVL